MKKISAFLLIICISTVLVGCGAKEYIQTLDNYTSYKFTWKTNLKTLQKDFPDLVHMEGVDMVANAYEAPISDSENFLCRALKETEDKPRICFWIDENKCLNQVMIYSNSSSDALSEQLAKNLVKEATAFYGDPVYLDESENDFDSSVEAVYYVDNATITIMYQVSHYIDITPEEIDLYDYPLQYVQMVNEHNEFLAGKAILQIKYQKPE